MSSDSANSNLDFFHYLPDLEDTDVTDDILFISSSYINSQKHTFQKFFTQNSFILKSLLDIRFHQETNIKIESIYDFIRELNPDLTANIEKFTIKFKNSTLDNFRESHDSFEPDNISSNLDIDFVLEGTEAEKFIENINNPDPKRKALRKKTIERIRNKYKK